MSRVTSSSSVVSRSFQRVVPIRATKKGKRAIVPKKPCENARGNGIVLCTRTLSGRSKYSKCDYCRKADKKWKVASAHDVLKWYTAYSLRVYRISPYLPEDVATVKKRA